MGTIGSWVRHGGIVVASMAFGLLDRRLWEGGGSSSFWLANMSSFWLLLPFAAGAVERTMSWAATAGLLSTGVALSTFYADALTSPGRLPVGAHRYFVGGLITGPAFGLLGGLWLRRGWRLCGLAPAAAFCLEPWAWREHLGFLPDPTYLWAAEVAIGVALAVAVVMRARLVSTTSEHLPS